MNVVYSFILSLIMALIALFTVLMGFFFPIN